MKDQVNFVDADKHKKSLQVDAITFDGHDQTCPKYPIQQVAVSLQYHKKEVKHKVDFLLEDKHQSFLQINCIIFGCCGKACPKHIN